MSRCIAAFVMVISLMVGLSGSAFAQTALTGTQLNSSRVETRPCNLTLRKAARDLTGDVANSVHFFWGSAELRY